MKGIGLCSSRFKELYLFADNAFAFFGFRLCSPFGTVPAVLAAIKRIAQNPGTALQIAVDRRHAPLAISCLVLAVPGCAGRRYATTV